jgi:hypothetical protein
LVGFKQPLACLGGGRNSGVRGFIHGDGFVGRRVSERGAARTAGYLYLCKSSGKERSAPGDGPPIPTARSDLFSYRTEPAWGTYQVLARVGSPERIAVFPRF